MKNERVREICGQSTNYRDSEQVIVKVEKLSEINIESFSDVEMQKPEKSPADRHKFSSPSSLNPNQKQAEDFSFRHVKTAGLE